MQQVLLVGDEITLRPARYRDRKKWNQVRLENRDWLSPWEATLPILPDASSAHESNVKWPAYFEMVSLFKREARAGRSFSFLIWHEKNLIGQITMGGVILGALRGAHIGYWIDRSYANRGLMTAAVRLLSDFGFSQLGLHRIEINIRPENAASCKVAEKAEFEFEGHRKAFLHIDGAWRDHVCFVKYNDLIK